MEQNTNKPRELDLRGRRLLVAICGRCGHESLRDVLFQAGRTAEIIAGIEARLRCQKCGNWVGNHLELAKEEPRVPRGPDG